MTILQPPTRQFTIPEKISSLGFEKGQILNFFKPEGWTSFDVVKKIRNHIKINKIGHAGTLDPFASGVLLICTGKATKSFDKLMTLEKEYWAYIELGKVTDTFDRTGVVLKQNSSQNIPMDKIKKVCQMFKGEIYQIPPMYSALKVNGQRLYKLARQGKTVNRKPRRINIYEIEIMDFQNPIVELRVVCSKGTYIRSLANDIGEKLGCGAYLESLIRTRIGPYKIESAYSISDFIRLHNYQ